MFLILLNCSIFVYPKYNIGPWRYQSWCWWTTFGLLMWKTTIKSSQWISWVCWICFWIKQGTLFSHSKCVPCWRKGHNMQGLWQIHSRRRRCKQKGNEKFENSPSWKIGKSKPFSNSMIISFYEIHMIKVKIYLEISLLELIEVFKKHRVNKKHLLSNIIIKTTSYSKMKLLIIIVEWNSN